MSLAVLYKRVSSPGAVAVAVLLGLGLGWAGLAAADELDAQPPAPPTAFDVVAELGRRFHLPADKQLQMAAMVALAGKGSSLKDLRQALEDTLAALKRSNAEDDLSAPPVPTGDALFDRYALAVDQRLNTFPASEAKDVAYLAALSDAELAQWESDFGQDPRYWELRYLCAKCGNPQSPLAADFANPSDFLDEAQKRGVATANTLLFRYKELREANDAELEPFAPPVKKEKVIVEGHDLGSREVPNWDALNNALPLSQDPQAQAAIAIMQRQEQEQLALLNAAVKAGPDQAWPYYMRALYWFELGEQDQGLDDLEAGNAAPVNVFPAPWPRGYISACPAQPAPVGSAAVSGALLMTFVSYEIPLTDQDLKDAMSSSLACMNLNGNPRPLEAWHQFACRFSQSYLDNRLFAIGRDSVISGYMEADQAAALTPEQLDTLQRCRGATLAYREAALGATQDYWIDNAIALIPFAGIRGVAVGAYLVHCDNWRWQHKAVPDTLVADLSQVHYPELALPECMKKYEALSREEVKRRRAEQREQEQQERAAQAAAAEEQDGDDSR